MTHDDHLKQEHEDREVRPWSLCMLIEQKDPIDEVIIIEIDATDKVVEFVAMKNKQAVSTMR